MTGNRSTLAVVAVVLILAAGVVPSVAMGQAGNETTATSTATPITTETPGDGLTSEARVAIQQPEYLGSTQTVADGGRTVHVFEAQKVEVQPQNFDNSDVIGFGVSEGPGELSYDAQMDQFIFDSRGETGTFEVYWEVEEQIQTGNGVETARTRYTATLRSDSNATYRHLTQSELNNDESGAANWSEWEDTLQSIYGDDVDVEQKTQKAAELLRLANKPLAALSGEFSGLLLALFITLGGMLLLALIGVLHLAARWTDIKYINRFESLKAEERDVDKRLSDLDWREKMRSVAKWDWNDWFGDYTARSYREVGETPFDGMKELLASRRPKNLIDHRLQCMAVDGYVGVVERDDVATDGGDGDSEPAIISARVEEERYVDEGAETFDISDPSDEFIAALDWESNVLWSYSLSETDATPEDIHVEQAPIELEELVEALGAETRDFDSRQHWGQYLLEFVQFVRDHEFCDEEGRPDDIQFVMAEWMDVDDFLADAFDMPHFKAESEAIEWAVKQSDPVEQADNRVNTVTEGRDLDLSMGD